MLTGLLLILLGIMIYLHPKILVALLSGVLIMTGLTLIALHYRLRRAARTWEQGPNRWMRFLIRF